MPNAKDLVPGDRIRVLFIGKSGTRKSTVAGSFPDPKYMFDFDGRIKALQGVDIDYDTYTRLAGWGKADRKMQELLDAGKEGRQKYKTIVFSSMTTILDFFLWEAKQHYSKETKGGLRIKRPHTNTEVLLSDMPHYKYVHQVFDSLMNDYILPLGFFYNVIVEAHEQTKFDKEGDPIGDEVLATPSLAQRLPTVFDETWQFKTKKPSNPKEGMQYIVHFRNNYLAKTAYRSLPDSVEITNREHRFFEDIFMKRIQVNE